MRTLIKRCPKCGRYSIKGLCPECQTKTLSSSPPRYSPEDRYGRIRRETTY